MIDCVSIEGCLLCSNNGISGGESGATRDVGAGAVNDGISQEALDLEVVDVNIVDIQQESAFIRIQTSLLHNTDTLQLRHSQSYYLTIESRVNK